MNNDYNNGFGNNNVPQTPQPMNPNGMAQNVQMNNIAPVNTVQPDIGINQQLAAQAAPVNPVPTSLTQAINGGNVAPENTMPVNQMPMNGVPTSLNQAVNGGAAPVAPMQPNTTMSVNNNMNQMPINQGVQNMQQVNQPVIENVQPVGVNQVQGYENNPYTTSSVDPQNGQEKVQEFINKINGLSKGKKILIGAGILVIAFIIMNAFGINGTFSLFGISFTRSSNTTIVDDNNDNTNNTTTIDNNNDNTDNTSDTSDTSNSGSVLIDDAEEFNGMLIYSNDDAQEIFSVTLPSEYESGDYALSYHFEGPEIEININGLQNYKDAKRTANGAYNYYKKNYDETIEMYKSMGMNKPITLTEPTRPEKKTINGIDWYVVKTYSVWPECYCFTQQGSAVYLLDIKAQTNAALNINENTIVNSIKIK